MLLVSNFCHVNLADAFHLGVWSVCAYRWPVFDVSVRGMLLSCLN